VFSLEAAPVFGAQGENYVRGRDIDLAEAVLAEDLVNLAAELVYWQEPVLSAATDKVQHEAWFAAPVFGLS
jgi:hypothetical protein